MAEAGSLSFQRKDWIYIMAIAASFGGGQLLDRGGTANIQVIIEKVATLERNVNELRDPGGPVLRETLSRVKSQDDALHDLQKTIRGGVSRETIDDVRARLAEARDNDKDFRQQIDGLRAAIESLRAEIAQAVGRRLVGPQR